MTIQQQIHDKLTAALQPSHLEVINESHQHAVPKGSESHFKVIIAAPCFRGLSLLARHRKINECLAQELAGMIHALSIHAYTPEDWQQRQQAPESPRCLGGSAREK